MRPLLALLAFAPLVALLMGGCGHTAPQPAVRGWARPDASNPRITRYAHPTLPPSPESWPEQYLDGGADEDDGEILTFNVSDEDRALFPALARRKAVRIYEREDGFVVEVRGCK